MTMKQARDTTWQLAKISMILAFICMDFTHSFPVGSWARFFDNAFWIAFVAWFVLNIDLKVTKQ